MASLGSSKYIWNIISRSSRIVASRYFSRARRIVSLTCIRSKSTVSVLWLRNSPPKLASTGTALRTVPPVISPTLKVVSSSSRPLGSSLMISDAMRIADSPFSGSTPA